jgi:transcriptional regulator with XRE-family HTH domain
MPLDNLGTQIIDYRKKQNITQAQLAIEMGVSQVTIANWEFGRFRPKGEALEKLKKLMDPDIPDIDTSDLNLMAKICKYFTAEEIPLLGKMVERLTKKQI